LRSIGIDTPPPKKTCNDSKCPFHGSLKVRGRLIEGRAASLKAKSTVVVEREYLLYVKKFMRYEKRRNNIHAHLPPCIGVKDGDHVTIAECRPIAKAISYVVIGKAD
jgi:small subunit ribosomal protein S17